MRIFVPLLWLFSLLPGQAFSADLKQKPAQAKPAAITAISNVTTGLPQGDAQAGRAKSEQERCQECHGADGQGNGHIDGNGKVVKFPKLGGQLSVYLAKQMHDFRSGARKFDFMNMMAKSVDDQDLADILAYYASLATMQGDGAQDDAGKRLYQQGDATRGVIGCATCHGAGGRGLTMGAIAIPALAGQESKYLAKQLDDWRSGQRSNHAGGVMGMILKPLTEPELQALTRYLAGLK